MNRLLMAAARGAQIQTNFGQRGEWHNDGQTKLYELNAQPGWLRIHPDDTLLQYGPVSRALREAAEQPPLDLDFAFQDFEFLSAVSIVDDWHKYDEADNETRTLFLLLMAEAICDQGL